MVNSYLTCIPTAFEKFNIYYLNTSSFLSEGTPANYLRLGLTEEIFNGWKDIGKRWIPVYSRYTDKYNLRTPAVSDEMRSIMEDARKFENEHHMIALISISPNATVNDLETFNIRSRSDQKKNPSQSLMPITTLVDAILQPIGGGSVTIKCYGNTGQRPSIQETADCVQYRFVVGDSAPASAEDKSLDMNLSTRGLFVLQLGAETAGQQLFIYFRWYNIKHPELAGPWSKLQSTIIL
jgi:hypothetical protein